MKTILASMLLLAAVAAAAPAERPAEDARWSAANQGLEARLSVARKGVVVGTPTLATYLELRNVSDNPDAMYIPLDVQKIAFTVTDEAGKMVDPEDGDYDGSGTQPGAFRLPYDSYVRFNIAGRGAGVPRAEAAILDLGPGHVWVFKAGDRKAYYLQAKLTIAQPKEARWSGTVEMPKVRIPTAGE